MTSVSYHYCENSKFLINQSKIYLNIFLCVNINISILA